MRCHPMGPLQNAGKQGSKMSVGRLVRFVSPNIDASYFKNRTAGYFFNPLITFPLDS
jgi:hypothetical protein